MNRILPTLFAGLLTSLPAFAADDASECEALWTWPEDGAVEVSPDRRILRVRVNADVCGIENPRLLSEAGDPVEARVSGSDLEAEIRIGDLAPSTTYSFQFDWEAEVPSGIGRDTEYSTAPGPLLSFTTADAALPPPDRYDLDVLRFELNPREDAAFVDIDWPDPDPRVSVEVVVGDGREGRLAEHIHIPARDGDEMRLTLEPLGLRIGRRSCLTLLSRNDGPHDQLSSEVDETCVRVGCGCASTPVPRLVWLGALPLLLLWARRRR